MIFVDMMHLELSKILSGIVSIKEESVEIPVGVVKCSIKHSVPNSWHTNVWTHSWNFIFSFWKLPTARSIIYWKILILCQSILIFFFNQFWTKFDLLYKKNTNYYIRKMQLKSQINPNQCDVFLSQPQLNKRWVLHENNLKPPPTETQCHQISAVTDPILTKLSW